MGGPTSCGEGAIGEIGPTHGRSGNARRAHCQPCKKWTPRPPSPNGKDARPSGNWGEPRAGAHARSSPPATARKPKHSTETAAPLASRRQNTNPLMTPPLVPAGDAPPKIRTPRRNPVLAHPVTSEPVKTNPPPRRRKSDTSK